MPRTRSPTNTAQISVTLPTNVLDLLEDLIGEDLYGPTRAQVAAQLILDHLKVLRAQGVVPPKSKRRHPKRIA